MTTATPVKDARHPLRDRTAAFKAAIWHRVAPAPVAAVVVLLLLLLLAPHVSTLLLAGLVVLTLGVLARRGAGPTAPDF